VKVRLHAPSSRLPPSPLGPRIERPARSLHRNAFFEGGLLRKNGSFHLHRPGLERAFTLVEVLGFLAVAALLACLGGGLLSNSWRSTRRFQADCEHLEWLLRQTQQGAVTRSEYRYVVFWEPGENADPEKPPGSEESEETEGEEPSVREHSSSAHSSASSCPQPADLSNPRRPELPGLRIAVYARSDGALGFDPRSPQRSWVEQTLRCGALRPVAAVQRFESLRLAASLPPPESGPMSREPVHRFERIGHPAGRSVLRLPRPQSSSGEDLRRILQFAPDGRALIVHHTNASSLVRAVEIGLQPVWIPRRQPTASGQPGGRRREPEDGEPPVDPEHPQDAPRPNPRHQQQHELHAALQISGINGRIRLYLP
jgi:hypothetical protein